MKVRKYAKKLAPVAMALALVAGLATPASAAVLTSISVTSSNSTPSATGVTYSIQASNVTTSAIGCIQVRFNTAADGSGSKPTGMGVAAATVAGNWIPTPGSWAVARNDSTGVVQLTGSAQTPANSGPRTIDVGAVTNPSSTTPFYVIVNTYTGTDCSTGPVDNGTAMATATDNTTVTAIVDPTFTFTVGDHASACNGNAAGIASTASAVNLGNVNAGVVRTANQAVTISTNAANGYSVYARSTAPLTSGANSIANAAALNTAPAAAPAAGTAFFGYTSGDTTLSAIGNGASRFNGGLFAGLSTTNAEVAYSGTQPVSAETNCVGYRVSVAGTTPAGSYSTSVIYTAVPAF